MNPPSKTRVITAYAAVYLIWGSTYLAIRFAIESMPPFLMTGVRFFIAGWLLFAFAQWRGAKVPKLSDWKAPAIIGALMLLGGNGGVTYAEQFISSGLTALLVATVPIWMVVFAWLGGLTGRPSLAVSSGLLLGFGGLFLLVDPTRAHAQSNEAWGTLVVVLASASWAIGSLYSSRHKSELSSLTKAGMQMVCGGALLALFGLMRGEWAQFHWAAVTHHSLMAFWYLLFVGSLIGFTTYIWLLQVSAPSKVATYAYVNPVVAVFLGWALADETLNTRTIIGAAIIVAGVAIVISCQSRKP